MTPSTSGPPGSGAHGDPFEANCDTFTGPDSWVPLATGTWIGSPSIWKITPVANVVCAATVKTTWATAVGWDRADSPERCQEVVVI